MNNYSEYKDTGLLDLLCSVRPFSDQAFDIIYNRYSARLNAYCIYKSANREDSEELFEDTWLKFLDRIRNGKKLDKILPYLFSIARTLAIDRYRKERSKKQVTMEYKEMSELSEYKDPNSFLNDIENAEMIIIVKNTLKTFDDKHREAFVLHWFGGLSHGEIAKLLGISTAGVKMRCHRAMKSLIKILRPKFAENIK